MAAVTGARRSEILGIAWEDLDLEAGMVGTHGRGGSDYLAPDTKSPVRSVGRGGLEPPIGGS